MRDMVKLPVDDSEEMISATRKAAVCRLPIGDFPVQKKNATSVCFFSKNIPKDVAGLDKSFLR